MATKEMTKPLAAYSKIGNASLTTAVKNGGALVWASCLIMGLGNIAAGQYIKGLMFLAIEIAFVFYMATNGLHWLSMLPSLGDTATAEVWDEDLGVYVYQQGDNSQQILLYAVATIAVIIAFAVICINYFRQNFVRF